MDANELITQALDNLEEAYRILKQKARDDRERSIKAEHVMDAMILLEKVTEPHDHSKITAFTV